MPLFSRKSKPPPTANGYAIINRRILVSATASSPIGPGERPGYAYREPPDDPSRGDTGWRLFVGDETQDEADQADNFHIVALANVLAHHPELQAVVSENRDGAWEWSDQVARYVAVEDPVPLR